MKTEEKTNIISESEFLQSLGLSVKNTVSSENKKDDTVKLDEEQFIDNLKGNIDSENKPSEDSVPKVTEEEVSESNEEEISKPSEEDIKIEEEKSLKRFGVKDTINSLIENDIWSDIAIKFGDKEYGSIEELLASERPTRELFDSLSQVQKNLREERLKEEYVSIKDKDETKVKLINAILSDVDYEDLLQYNRQVVEPVKRLDFTNQNIEVTENFVRQCLKDIINIQDDDYINFKIEELKKDFKLIEKAEEFQEIVIKNFNDELEIRTKSQEAVRAKEEEERSNNIKEFKKLLKGKEFSDSFIQKAAQLRYAKEQDGKFHYEKLLEDKLKDGNFASKFIHFLLDEEDFLNKEKSKVKAETAKKMMELVHIIPKDKGSKVSSNGKPSIAVAEEEFINELKKNIK
ncbi:MAG: hypothetical protein LBM02_10010 [Lachnospiraceae bacterium]|jgi:hypothetical protein|nr:hypothetical protein [Lachnospiraceae bacterium]